jgi:hypothetical protein
MGAYHINVGSNNPTVYIDGPSAKCWKTLTVYASSKLHKILIILKLLRLAKERVASSNSVSRANIQSSSRDAFLSPCMMVTTTPFPGRSAFLRRSCRPQT